MKTKRIKIRVCVLSTGNWSGSGASEAVMKGWHGQDPDGVISDDLSTVIEDDTVRRWYTIEADVEVPEELPDAVVRGRVVT